MTQLHRDFYRRKKSNQKLNPLLRAHRLHQRKNPKLSPKSPKKLWMKRTLWLRLWRRRYSLSEFSFVSSCLNDVFILGGIWTWTGTGTKWVVWCFVEAFTLHLNWDMDLDLLCLIVLVPVLVPIPVPLSVNTAWDLNTFQTFWILVADVVQIADTLYRKHCKRY